MGLRSINEKYYLLRKLGEGSFGSVHEARLITTGQMVAVKAISKAGKSEEEILNMRNEIKLMQQIQHRNAVKYLDMSEDGENIMFVMEKAHADLSSIQKTKEVLSENLIHMIMKQLVDVIAFLHKSLIVHRDIKPQNVLIFDGNVVKICDFGLSRMLESTNVLIQSHKGTPLYMSPQQLQNKPYDFKTDVWSLGCLMYELAFQRPPFNVRTSEELKRRVSTGKDVEIPIREDLSGEFYVVLKSMLKWNDKERPSMREIQTYSFIQRDYAGVNFSPLFDDIPDWYGAVADAKETEGLVQMQNVAKTTGGLLTKNVSRYELSEFSNEPSVPRDDRKRRRHAGHARTHSFFFAKETVDAVVKGGNEQGNYAVSPSFLATPSGDDDQKAIQQTQQGSDTTATTVNATQGNTGDRPGFRSPLCKAEMNTSEATLNQQHMVDPAVKSAQQDDVLTISNDTTLEAIVEWAKENEMDRKGGTVDSANKIAEFVFWRFKGIVEAFKLSHFVNFNEITQSGTPPDGKNSKKISVPTIANEIKLVQKTPDLLRHLLYCLGIALDGMVEKHTYGSTNTPFDVVVLCILKYLAIFLGCNITLTEYFFPLNHLFFTSQIQIPTTQKSSYEIGGKSSNNINVLFSTVMCLDVKQLVRKLKRASKLIIKAIANTINITSGIQGTESNQSAVSQRSVMTATSTYNDIGQSQELLRLVYCLSIIVDCFTQLMTLSQLMIPKVRQYLPSLMYKENATKQSAGKVYGNVRSSAYNNNTCYKPLFVSKEVDDLKQFWKYVETGEVYQMYNSSEQQSIRDYTSLYDSLIPIVNDIIQMFLNMQNPPFLTIIYEVLIHKRSITANSYKNNGELMKAFSIPSSLFKMNKSLNGLRLALLQHYQNYVCWVPKKLKKPIGKRTSTNKLEGMVSPLTINNRAREFSPMIGTQVSEYPLKMGINDVNTISPQSALEKNIFDDNFLSSLYFYPLLKTGLFGFVSSVLRHSVLVCYGTITDMYSIFTPSSILLFQNKSLCQQNQNEKGMNEQARRQMKRDLVSKSNIEFGLKFPPYMKYYGEYTSKPGYRNQQFLMEQYNFTGGDVTSGDEGVTNDNTSLRTSSLENNGKYGSNMGTGQLDVDGGVFDNKTAINIPDDPTAIISNNDFIISTFLSIFPFLWFYRDKDLPAVTETNVIPNMAKIINFSIVNLSIVALSSFMTNNIMVMTPMLTLQIVDPPPSGSVNNWPKDEKLLEFNGFKPVSPIPNNGSRVPNKEHRFSDIEIGSNTPQGFGVRDFKSQVNNGAKLIRLAEKNFSSFIKPLDKRQELRGFTKLMYFGHLERLNRAISERNTGGNGAGCNDRLPLDSGSTTQGKGDEEKLAEYEDSITPIYQPTRLNVFISELLKLILDPQQVRSIAMDTFGRLEYPDKFRLDTNIRISALSTIMFLFQEQVDQGFNHKIVTFDVNGTATADRNQKAGQYEDMFIFYLFNKGMNNHKRLNEMNTQVQLFAKIVKDILVQLLEHYKNVANKPVNSSVVSIVKDYEGILNYFETKYEVLMKILKTLNSMTEEDSFKEIISDINAGCYFCSISCHIISLMFMIRFRSSYMNILNMKLNKNISVLERELLNNRMTTMVPNTLLEPSTTDIGVLPQEMLFMFEYIIKIIEYFEGHPILPSLVYKGIFDGVVYYLYCVINYFINLSNKPNNPIMTNNTQTANYPSNCLTLADYMPVMSSLLGCIERISMMFLHSIDPPGIRRHMRYYFSPYSVLIVLSIWYNCATIEKRLFTNRKNIYDTTQLRNSVYGSLFGMFKTYLEKMTSPMLLCLFRLLSGKHLMNVMFYQIDSGGGFYTMDKMYRLGCSLIYELVQKIRGLQQEIMGSPRMIRNQLSPDGLNPFGRGSLIGGMMHNNSVIDIISNLANSKFGLLKSPESSVATKLGRISDVLTKNNAGLLLISGFPFITPKLLEIGMATLHCCMTTFEAFPALYVVGCGLYGDLFNTLLSMRNNISTQLDTVGVLSIVTKKNVEYANFIRLNIQKSVVNSILESDWKSENSILLTIRMLNLIGNICAFESCVICLKYIDLFKPIERFVKMYGSEAPIKQEYKLALTAQAVYIIGNTTHSTPLYNERFVSCVEPMVEFMEVAKNPMYTLNSMIALSYLTVNCPAIVEKLIDLNVIIIIIEIFKVAKMQEREIILGVLGRMSKDNKLRKELKENCFDVLLRQTIKTTKNFLAPITSSYYNSLINL